MYWGQGPQGCRCVGAGGPSSIAPAGQGYLLVVGGLGAKYYRAYGPGLPISGCRLPSSMAGPPIFLYLIILYLRYRGALPP